MEAAFESRCRQHSLYFQQSNQSDISKGHQVQHLGNIPNLFGLLARHYLRPGASVVEVSVLRILLANTYGCYIRTCRRILIPHIRTFVPVDLPLDFSQMLDLFLHKGYLCFHLLSRHLSRLPELGCQSVFFLFFANHLIPTISSSLPWVSVAARSFLTKGDYIFTRNTSMGLFCLERSRLALRQHFGRIFHDRH